MYIPINCIIEKDNEIIKWRTYEKLSQRTSISFIHSTGFSKITEKMHKVFTEFGLKEGFALVIQRTSQLYVFINDDEPGLHSDFENWLEGLAPEKPYLRRQCRCPFEKNYYEEQIFYYECDGKRNKRVLIKIIGQ